MISDVDLITSLQMVMQPFAMEIVLTTVVPRQDGAIRLPRTAIVLAVSIIPKQNGS